MYHRLLLIVVGMVWPFIGALQSLQADESEPAHFFETRVRPLLAARCLGCHGATKQQGGLRLDSRAAMLRGVDGAAAIQPGDPAASRLLQVVRYADDDTQMPPAGKLPDAEIAILTQWVTDGAVWPSEAESGGPQKGGIPLTADGEIDFAAAAASHWAFQPILKPTLPKVVAASTVRSPIDRFILSRLEAAGLGFSPVADRRTLIRRATFDLQGVPPTYEEVVRFSAAESDAAFDELIDRLLASPKFGQRWARHWLDVARYADTKGYVFTQNPKYPFAYTYRDYVVSSFNDDKPFDRFVVEQLAADQLGLPEGDPALAALGFLTVGRQFLGNGHDIIDDRIDVVTRGLMGLTVGCARCHDHKYDPIPIADYYSLYGVFNSSHEPEVLPVIGQPDDSAAYRAYRDELAQREQAVTDYIAQTHAELLKQARERVADYLFNVVKSAGKLPPTVELNFEHGEPRQSVTKLWEAKIAEWVQQQNPVFTPWRALAALPQDGFAEQAAAWLASQPANGEEADPAVNARVLQALRDSPPQSMVDVARTYGRLLQAADAEWQALAATGALSPESPPNQLPDPAAEQLRQILSGPTGLTAIPVDERLLERDHRDELTKRRRRVSEWDSESAGAPPRAMVLVDKETPVKPVVFLRGTPGRNGPQVPRRFPRVLAGADAAEFPHGSGRLDLAQAIASRDNPLTARVIVNRVWMQHFGAPLVTTPSDFGTRTDPATHPDLLEWLAASLIEHGWSLKWLHREIMTSTVYRQASIDLPEARRVDPENLLLWRMNRQRLEFEPMRDAMLAVAGRLDPALGGRPVDIEQSPQTGRRSIYAYIDRNNFSPLLRTFDFPSPDVHASGRPLTSVPQQALYAMNAPFPQQMAQHIAERPEFLAATRDEERVTALYRLILARDPLPDEQRLAVEFLATAQKPQQLAHALLLTNEFLFID